MLRCVPVSDHVVLSQYVRVMPAGGQCYELGPFFPSVPRHMTRMGIRMRSNLLLRPDWLVTGGLLFGAAVILCMCVSVLVSGHKGNTTLITDKCDFQQTSHVCRFCSENMVGLKRNPSEYGTASCSQTSAWTTSHPKVPRWFL